ncbi:M15 family metallopeptidase [soil metagenome]
MLHRTILGCSAAILLLALSGCTGLEPPASAVGTTPAIPDQIPVGGVPGLEDGYVSVGETVSLDDDVPAVTNLDPVLRDALAQAASEATERDVAFTFTDAWRSEGYQQFLFEQAVVAYGSDEEARRWVKPPDQSQHVLGKAVDVATADAMDWLTRFGAPYGLCQIYTNEAWHFEYVEGVDGDAVPCPPQLADSTAG